MMGKRDRSQVMSRFLLHTYGGRLISFKYELTKAGGVSKGPK